MVLTLLWMVLALPAHGVRKGAIETAVFAFVAFGLLYWRRPKSDRS